MRAPFERVLTAAVAGSAALAVPVATVRPVAAQGTSVAGVVANVDAQGNATLRWQAFAGATGYFVVRWLTNDANCCKVTSAPTLASSALSWQDGVLPKGGTYGYRVYATTANGTFVGEVTVAWQPGAVASSAASIAPPLAVRSGPAPGRNATLTAIAMSNGPAPTNFRVTGTVNRTDLAWDQVAGASSYELRRAVQGTTSWTILKSSGWLAMASSDLLPDWRVSYVYEIKATQADGSYGVATLTYTPPPPMDPADFRATQTGEGEVELTWSISDPFAQYLISGPGATNGVTVAGAQSGVTQRSHTLTGVPAGSHTWTIATSYESAGVLTQSTVWPRTSLAVRALSARYRVTMIGFDVNAQSDGDPIFDGDGDEVYLAAVVSHVNTGTGALGPSGSIRSLVFGDAQGFQGRIYAGTLTPQGGLKTGDAYPLSGGGTLPPAPPRVNDIPMLLWEGQLTEGLDLLVVAPAVWESDGKDTPFAEWSTEITTGLSRFLAATSVKNELAAATITPVRTGSTHYIRSIPGPDVDHPVGMAYVSGVNSTYVQYLLLLTRTRIEAALNPGQTFGGPPPGVIAVPLRDSAGIGFAAAYTVYLRIERLP